jgi:hypothetical protein
LEFLVSSFGAALRLIGSFSPDVVDAVGTSLSVRGADSSFRLNGGSIVLEEGRVAPSNGPSP